MHITRTSMLSDVEHTLDLPVTQEQLDRYAAGGVLLQEAFPHLSPPEREFIKTGITPDEFAEAFPPCSEDLDEAADDAEVLP